MTQSSTFLAGWMKLSDELRLEIIRLALPVDQHILLYQFDRNRRRKDWAKNWQKMMNVTERFHQESLFIFDREVLPLVACPATAAFALEAFWT